MAGVWVLLAAATLVVYAPALHGEFIWDDGRNITESPNMEGTDGLWRIWTEPSSTQQYYPLTHTSFWLNYRVSGLNPFGYHLTNVLLHATNAFLLFLVLARLRVPGPLVAAAVFALHPVQVESVAWITERKNVLAALPMLAALLAYLRFARIGAGGAGTVASTRACSRRASAVSPCRKPGDRIRRTQRITPGRKRKGGMRAGRAHRARKARRPGDGTRRPSASSSRRFWPSRRWRHCRA
jgi:hypothetical protein